MDEETGAPRFSELSRALREALQANTDATHALAARLGLGLSDLSALDHLAGSPHCMGPVELGHRLGMRSASATVLVDRLEKAGHVARLPHPDDRRRISLAVTATARQELLAALAPLTGAVDELASRLSPEDARVAAQFLRDVAQAFRAFAEAPDPGAVGPE
ncbi:MAG: MarR family winged helix-turn-helix transcriptional regulator [Propionicimonas sp.]